MRRFVTLPRAETQPVRCASGIAAACGRNPARLNRHEYEANGAQLAFALSAIRQTGARQRPLRSCGARSFRA
jgi:hypothetical protein